MGKYCGKDLWNSERDFNRRGHGRIINRYKRQYVLGEMDLEKNFQDYQQVRA